MMISSKRDAELWIVILPLGIIISVCAMSTNYWKCADIPKGIHEGSFHDSVTYAENTFEHHGLFLKCQLPEGGVRTCTELNEMQSMTIAGMAFFIVFMISLLVLCIVQRRLLVSSTHKRCCITIFTYLLSFFTLMTSILLLAGYHIHPSHTDDKKMIPELQERFVKGPSFYINIVNIFIPFFRFITHIFCFHPERVQPAEPAKTNSAPSPPEEMSETDSSHQATTDQSEMKFDTLQCWSQGGGVIGQPKSKYELDETLFTCDIGSRNLKNAGTFCRISRI